MMLQTGLLKPKPIVCCIGPSWKSLMKTIATNMEVTPKDVLLLKYYKTMDQFQNKIDNIIKQIEDRDKKAK